MPIDKDRVLEARDYIRDQVRDEKFNMSFYVRGKSGCGTVACIAGHIYIKEHPDLDFSDADVRVLADEKAEKFAVRWMLGLKETDALPLGWDTHEVSSLFIGYDDAKGTMVKPLHSLTRQNAVSALNSLYATGKPHWGITGSYQVDQTGTILSPGKFQGEQIFVIYYHNQLGDGTVISTLEDGQGIYQEQFEITEDEKSLFPYLEGYDYIIISENDLGFVSHELVKIEPVVDTALQEGTRFEQLSDGNDIG